MKCDEVELNLSDFLEHNLAESDLRNVQMHLDLCAACSLLFKEMQTTLALCGSYPQLEPPPRLVEGILAQTFGRYQSLSWVEYLREMFRPIYSTPRFALGACVAVISFTIVMNAFGVKLNHIKWSDLRPKSLLQNVNRTVYLAYDNGVRRINDLRILYQIQSKIDEIRSEQAETPNNPGKKAKETSRPQENSATEHLIGEKVSKRQWHSIQKGPVST
jgi:Putative zinc-finger